MTKRTLVLGGSLKPERYSNKAIRSLVAHKHEVVSIGLRTGRVGEISIETGIPSYKNIHTVTVYLNRKNQQPYWGYLLSLKPQRIIFNPGAENPDLAHKCSEAGIEVMEDCTLVMLDWGIY